MSLYMRRQPGGRLPPETALEIATQIAGAVCRVHKRGLTHLDLKPSSVIVAENGGRVAAKVTDTGLTVFLEMAGLLPRWGSGTGKPGFFAPERLFPEGKAGKAADVFSVCALLLFMLAGHTPEALGSIVKKGLSANPDERFADACELAAALERVAR